MLYKIVARWEKVELSITTGLPIDAIKIFHPYVHSGFLFGWISSDEPQKSEISNKNIVSPLYSIKDLQDGYPEDVLTKIALGDYGNPTWTYCDEDNFAEKEVKNNDGRECCIKCGKPTIQIPTLYFNRHWDICNNPECEWYKK